MKTKGILFILFFTLLFNNCKKLEIDSKEPIKSENEINTFIWKSLNSWYYWQNDVENLKDSRFNNINELNTFLNSYSSPADFFQSLKSSQDRFSWIVDDYVALQNSFQGTSKSFGFNFKLILFENQVLGYVEYVLPNSPASNSNLKRGDIFNKVNGQIITRENYNSLLNSESYKLGLVKVENKSVIDLQTEISMVAVELTENPVYLTKVFTIDDKKIGYLVYNQFIGIFHDELNNAIKTFQNENINELIIDLRYNPGGLVFTSATLASMIVKSVGTQYVYCKLKYNKKHSNNDENYSFHNLLYVLNNNYEITATKPLSKVNVSRVYFLTSNNTASASEMLINGIKPYINVIMIGDTTRGKNEGSITLYDSPSSDFVDKDKANPNHKWAIQPIVFKITNVLNFGEYSNGLIPDIIVQERNYFQGLKPLGDPDEILLQTALNHILGINDNEARVETKDLPPVNFLYSSLSEKNILYHHPITEK